MAEKNKARERRDAGKINDIYIYMYIPGLNIQNYWGELPVILPAMTETLSSG